MNNTNDKTAIDMPAAPNGHGASKEANGGRSGAKATEANKDARSLSKKKKKRKHHVQANQSEPQSIAPAVPAADPPAPVDTAPLAESSKLTAPIDSTPLVKSATSAEATAASETTAAADVPSSMEHATAPMEEPASVETAVESLRLRLKVWTDPETAKRYLMTSAFMRDVVGGQPFTDVMCAYAMRDDHTKVITLRAAEWNALPFFYFQEDGPAPRATARPIDVVP